MFCCISVTACLYNSDELLTFHPCHLLRQVKMKDTHKHTHRRQNQKNRTIAKKIFTSKPNIYLCFRPKDQPFNQGNSLISEEGGQFCLFEICPWEEEKETKYYRRNKIDFSSFHHLSFIFSFSTSEPRWDFFITPITQCTKHDSLLKRRPNFTFHIAMQSVKQVAFCSGTVNSVERDAQCDGDAKCMASY
jgi:hypothetical protein